MFIFSGSKHREKQSVVWILGRFHTYIDVRVLSTQILGFLEGWVTQKGSCQTTPKARTPRKEMLVYRCLFWLLVITSSISGLSLLVQRGSYRPDAYLVNGVPGTGQTPFERLAAFVFGLVYLVPILAMVYSYFFERSVRSTSISPAAYHLISSFGCLFVFPDALNPALASPFTSAMLHFAFFILFCLLYRISP